MHTSSHIREGMAKSDVEPWLRIRSAIKVDWSFLRRTCFPGPIDRVVYHPHLHHHPWSLLSRLLQETPVQSPSSVPRPLPHAPTSPPPLACHCHWERGAEMQSKNPHFLPLAGGQSSTHRFLVTGSRCICFFFLFLDWPCHLLYSCFPGESKSEPSIPDSRLWGSLHNEVQGLFQTNTHAIHHT